MPPVNILIFGYGLISKSLIENINKKNSKISIFTRSKIKLKNCTVYNNNFEDIADWNKFIKKDLVIIYTISIFNNNKNKKILDNKKFYKSFDKLMYLSKIKKIKKFIFLSSSAIYGLKYRSIINENSKILPESKYAKEKNILEQKLFENSRNFKVLIFRISNIYIDHKMIYEKNFMDQIIINKIRENTQILNGNEDDIRDYIQLSLVVKILSRSIVLNFIDNLNIYNLSSGKGLSYKDVFHELGVNKVISKSKKSTKVVLSNNKLKKTFNLYFKKNNFKVLQSIREKKAALTKNV